MYCHPPGSWGILGVQRSYGLKVILRMVKSDRKKSWIITAKPCMCGPSLDTLQEAEAKSMTETNPCTTRFVPDIREIRIRWVNINTVENTPYLFTQFLYYYFLKTLQPHYLQERLHTCFGAPYQKMGKTLRCGATTTCLHLQHRAGQCGAGSHQPFLCSGGA